MNNNQNLQTQPPWNPVRLRIERHFSQHLTDNEIKTLTHALEKISTHARPLRPGRIRG